ncbi:MAG TPA: hypothetical protein VFA35_00020, partial [Burkholderiaceae bacterium]|nr:hypothetical protein [Burkholderiaceae bacterium]
VVDEALQQHAGDWSLLLARATLRHDENDFRRELSNDPAFAQRRADAFADFADAAAAYQKKVPELLREEESTDVYDHWFYAALGSSELANVTHEQVVDQRQIDAVKSALLALPGDAGERHLANFANGLFSRMSTLRPPVKFRYLKAGLAIVGDHKQAFEARKLFDYYKDLVTEIRLETRVDGSTTVPSGEPFGMFVDLRHTREIERESGGFGRYLRNQNDVNYSYNYGRPTEDYRDKFQQMCKDSLGENFEVLSVTFQTENVHSRATDEYGWRITPYAYVMLKARGPQIDRIPALRLDLDFLDTSGYVVLPVESPALAIETKADAPPRPAADLEITQILDERQAKDGKLMLEVKATGHGMMPPLAQVLDLQPAGFVVDKTEDTGPQMSRFDPNEQAAIVGERTWNLTLRAKDGLPEVPRTFAFGKPRNAGSKLVLQRYADADLVAATPEVELLASYGAPSRTGLWLAIAGGLLVIALGSLLFVFRRRAPVEAGGLRLPDQLTPFTVLGLLREIRARDGLDAGSVAELDGAIARVEAGYFSAAAAASQDLRALASDWVARAGRQSVAG